MDCYFCKQENIGRTHHCPEELRVFQIKSLESPAIKKPRMHPYKFTIWAMAIIGLAVVIVRWSV